MKTAEPIEERICPKCGASYTGVSATSRYAEYDCICPDCGVKEALESIGVPQDEQEKILDIVHSANTIR